MFSAQFSQTLKKGDRILLLGDLGAGKTTLVSSIAKALNTKSHVSSPTFTLINQYQADIPIVHMDLYRIENIGAIHDLDLDRFFKQNDNIIFIEWAERLKDQTPKGAITINITFGENDSQRIFKINTPK